MDCAQIADVLEEHGPGIYTVQVWATLDGEPADISGVSSSTKLRCRGVRWVSEVMRRSVRISSFVDK